MAKLKVILRELKRVQKQLSGLNAAISAFTGVRRGTSAPRKRRKLSAQARAKIAAAQRARWAKVRAAKKKAA